MSESKPASVVFTNAALLANQAQQTANQAVASAKKYRTEWEEVNSENLAALSTAQSEFESNLAWAKSQIYEGQHQNDSAVASLQSDMESSWQSMSTVEDSLYNSASTATSEADSRLESLRAQNSLSLADLHSAANSLHAAANSLHADADSMRSSLTATTSELGKDITSTRNSLDGVRNSLRSATSEVGNDLDNARNSLAAVDADLRNGIKQAGTDLANAKTSLTATGNSLANRAGSLATATSELQRQTGQISGSLSTANSMIMYNSNAIAEVKRTAGEISTTVSTLKAGNRNYARKTYNEWKSLTGFTGATKYLTGLGTFVLEDLKVDDTVTIGYTVKNSGIQSGTFRIEAPGNSTGWNAGSIYGTFYDISKVCPDGATTTLIQYYTLTADNLKNSSFDFQIRADNFPAGTLSYKGLFVKKGNLATDWTPAPEDTDQAISTVSQTADAIRADLTNTQGDVASVKATASSLQSQITDNKNNISSVKQTADSINTSLTNAKGDISKLQQTAKGLQTSVSDNAKNISSVKQTADSLTTRMTNAEGSVSSLQQTASGLTSRVGNAEGNISQLQQTANGLTSTVSNLHAGDRNYIRGTSDSWANLTDFNNRANWCLQLGTFYLGDLKEGDKITLGITLKNTGVTGGKILLFQGNGDVKGWTFGINNGYDITKLVSAGQTVEFRTVKTLRANDVANNSINLQIRTDNVPAGGTLSAKCVFIKRGTLATDWTPAPEDTDSFISQIKQTADRIQSQVNDNKGNISSVTQTANAVKADLANTKGDVASVKAKADSLTTQMADAKGNISQLQQTAKGLQTQITNTNGDVSSLQVKADGISADLTNAKNDIASVRVKADSLTSSMSNANNQISTLQQRADSLTSTLSNGGVNLLNNSQGNFQPKKSAIDNWQRFDGVTVYMTHGRNYTVSAQASPDFVFSGTHDPTAESNRIVLWLVDNNGGRVISSDTTDISKGGTHFTWDHASGTYALRVNSYKKDNSGYAHHVQIEYGDTATPWQPSNGDISNLQQTASQLTSDVRDSKKNISSLQQTAKELDAQIKSVDGKATTIKATADGVSARVSKIEGNKVVGSLLKLDGNEAGLGTYVNNKLIAGINTNPDGVCIEGKNIHLNGQTHIDDGVINARKITVHNSVGNADGSATDQLLAVAWGQLNSTIGKTTDNGKTSLWGSINQTADKFSSYYTKSDIDNTLSQQSSLISQTADDITAIVNDVKTFSTYTVSSSNTWDFDYTKSTYGNWFLNGETSGNYVYNGPRDTNKNPLTPFMYVTSRGPKDGSRFVVTVWKDNDPTQYQRIWNGGSWSEWVMLPNSQNLISAINLSPDSVKISGKNIELNGNTKVTGRLDLMQDQNNWVNQSTNYHNPWSWNNAHIYFDNYLQLLGENCDVVYTDTTHLNGGSRFYSITTLTPGYLKFTTYQNKVSTTDENFDGQIARTYIDSSRIETNDVWAGDLRIVGHHIRPTNGNFVMISNSGGTNFDGNGSVGFQLYGGVGLGKNTIYCRSGDLYVQIGNAVQNLDQSYDSAGKVNIHCGKVTSQWANTVSSRLSVKTAITKVTYDRALMAVQNTDMYDYRYTTDDTGQHYVSGIIDDIHDKPEYNMDPMLINQERTARIDANLLGYHHVVLQEILKRLDKLEAK